MRVLIDTNVFISHLLNAHGRGPIQLIFKAWGEGNFTLLVPEDLLDEILVTVSGKPRLAKRISPTQLQAFLDILQDIGEIVPRIESPIPAVTRDPKDDYLLAYALVGGADYLVKGDDDLLVVSRHIEELSIITPRQFSEIARG